VLIPPHIHMAALLIDRPRADGVQVKKFMMPTAGAAV
jgi:hypothetical protein